MDHFDPVSYTSKLAICGMPIRIDSYRTCSFGCRYCFANNRVNSQHGSELATASPKSLQNRLERIFDDGRLKDNDLLDILIHEGYTWHWGGMSDPFQPCEEQYGITEKLLDITNRYDIGVLFSTKSDRVYGAELHPDLHAFQLSISNVSDRKDIEPGVPSIESRYRFYRMLKDGGFHVGIRIQPFIPDISSLEILDMFEDADHFVIEGLKVVSENYDMREFVQKDLGLPLYYFDPMGTLNLLPELRERLYRPFIDWFERHHASFSIADNDMRYLGNNKCCCGDALIGKSADWDITAMIHKHGLTYSRADVDKEIASIANAKFDLNRIDSSHGKPLFDFHTVKEYYDAKFDNPASLVNPSRQYRLHKCPDLLDYAK